MAKVKLEDRLNAVMKWVKLFEHHGEDAFRKSYTSYTVEFKLNVLNYMDVHGTSPRETAAIFNIPSPTQLFNWRKQMETEGLDALPPA